jgi:hypothetical protein
VVDDEEIYSGARSSMSNVMRRLCDQWVRFARRASDAPDPHHFKLRRQLPHTSHIRNSGSQSRPQCGCDRYRVGVNPTGDEATTGTVYVKKQETPVGYIKHKFFRENSKIDPVNVLISDFDPECFGISVNDPRCAVPRCLPHR